MRMEFPVTVMMRPFKGTDIYLPEDMPEIDVLIVTHEHWDHLDYATLRDLKDRVKQVVCPLDVAEYLEYWGYDQRFKEVYERYDSVDLAFMESRLGRWWSFNDSLPHLGDFPL